MANFKLSLKQQHAISAMIQQRFGLYFPPERFADMQRAVARAAVEAGYADISSYAEWLLCRHHDEEQLESLITNLTIGETYFFRDDALFSGLEKVVFPEIVKSGCGDKTVRLWCAACSTGEEAYSVAIMSERKKLIPPDWQLKIYATDINVKSLAKARDAIYSQWSFRAVSPALKEKYFLKCNARQWQLKENIRKLVEFSPLNLAQAQLAVGSNGSAKFDVILCRNVLMYFSAQRRAQILHNLTALLTDNGWLVVSPSEVGLVDEAQLAVVDVGGMLMHRKGQQNKGQQNKRQQDRSKTATLKLLPPVDPLSLGNLSSPQSRCYTQLHSVLNHQEHATRASLSTAMVDDAQPTPAKVPVAMPHTEALNTAQGLMQQREYRQAIEILQPLISDDLPLNANEQVSLMSLLGRCLANVGELEQAEQYLEKGLKLERLNSSSYYLLATVQQDLGKLEQAQKSLEQALYLDPDYIIATFSLGMLLKQRQFNQQGLKLLQRARLLLLQMDADAIVADSEGLTVAHLRHMLDGIICEQ